MIAHLVFLVVILIIITLSFFSTVEATHQQAQGEITGGLSSHIPGGRSNVSFDRDGDVHITDTIHSGNGTTVTDTNVNTGHISVYHEDDGNGGIANNTFTPPCLPDLQVTRLHFLDENGNTYYPIAVPKNIPLTPVVTVINNNSCSTHYTTSVSNNNHVTTYNTWIDQLEFGTEGRFPVQLLFDRNNDGAIDETRNATNTGPISALFSNLVSFPVVTFGTSGRHRFLLTADEPTLCADAKPEGTIGWQGCVFEGGEMTVFSPSGQAERTYSIGIGNENNNSLSQTITIVETEVPAVNCWVANQNRANNNCSTICEAVGGYPSADADGAKCESGNARPASALATLGTGNPPFRWGCGGLCNISNATQTLEWIAIFNQEIGGEHNTHIESTNYNICSKLGQIGDYDPKNFVVGCVCEQLPNNNCSPLPTIPDPTLIFGANPRTVKIGESTKLEWSAEYADTCTADRDWSGSKNSISGSEIRGPFTTTGNKQYFLTCVGQGGTITKSADVLIEEIPPNPVAVTFNSDQWLIRSGDKAKINWEISADYSASCTITGLAEGNKIITVNSNDSITGSGLSAPLTNTKFFTITCNPTPANGAPTINKKIQVDVVPTMQET